MINIDIKSDRSENVHYDYPEYFAYIRKGLLSIYPDFTALSHWHDDVEFITVLAGTMDYNINGTLVTLHEGEGLFVNTRQLHFGFSESRTECEFVCVLLHPMMLCISPQMEQSYVAPVLNNRSLPYQVLRPTVPWEKNIIKTVNKMYFQLDPQAPQLHLQSLFYALWMELYKNMPKDDAADLRAPGQLSCVKDMIRYIQDHYKEKIFLGDIADAGNICKSKCCALFRSFLDQTPINYLIRYRLQKSMELLENTDFNITEIGFKSGFSGTSYYIETFHKYFGVSPLEYRNKKKDIT